MKVWERMSIGIFPVNKYWFLLLTLNIFHNFYSVSIGEFKHLNDY